MECSVHGTVTDVNIQPHRHKTGRVYHTCRLCNIDRGRKYRNENRETINIRSKARYPSRREYYAEWGREYRKENATRLRERCREYDKAHRDERRAKGRARDAAQRLRLLAHYSNDAFSCRKCGETTLAFLTLDNINNDGASHRKEVGNGSQLYRWIERNQFPDGLQVLCYNCNFLKYLASKPESKNRKRAEYERNVKLDALTNVARGPVKCRLCSVMDARVLTIDHVNGGGNAHRRLMGFTGSQSTYAYIRKLKDVTAFAVLCYNHNSGKR